MSVKTVIRSVSDEDESIPIEIIATIPDNDKSSDDSNTNDNSKRVPIAITLRNVNDSQEMSRLQCYHYAIPKRNSKDIIDIPLLNTNNDWIGEVTRKIAVSTAKKYEKPCYIAWSSSSSIQNSFSPMDQLYILKKCINLLNTMIPK